MIFFDELLLFKFIRRSCSILMEEGYLYLEECFICEKKVFCIELCEVLMM